MATFEQLDALPSSELHDRATHRAERHLDVKFFWDLLTELPVAEAAAGDTGDAQADIQSAGVRIARAMNESPEVQDALRPFYIDYLLEHGDGG
jgi:hypothetical protein